METCYFCQGKVVKKTIKHLHSWGEKVFLFEDVPAEVCRQCGEVYFRPDILEVMDHIVNSDMEPKAEMSIPVFSIADAMQS
jgi:YgiT-type zinc finger domain-containing protein